MEKTCTEEDFLKIVKNHEMAVILDDGVHRHLKFSYKESSDGHFNITTWPGSLCIDGDYGTFVFSRTEDMFRFFRSREKPDSESRLSINVGYWGEKLVSISRFEGFSKFDLDSFEKRIKELFKEWTFNSENEKKEVWEDIRDKILNDDNDRETMCMRAASSYESTYGHEFTDFWEERFKVPTYHYLWCLYAIVWGIKQYDLKCIKESGEAKDD